MDVARVALVDHELVLEGGGQGRARRVRDEPGDISVATDAPGRELLVISESFSGGWAADIDGTPVVVEQVNGDFLGVVVPAGTHTATLTFSPPNFVVGSVISLASALVVALVAFGGWAGSIRRRASGP